MFKREFIRVINGERGFRLSELKGKTDPLIIIALAIGYLAEVIERWVCYHIGDL